jgi:uncharacterized protein (TIGR01777 family)
MGGFNMHIFITGGTGFIGETLVPQLIAEGHKLTIYSRKAQRSLAPTLSYLNSLDELSGTPAIDVVVNLAGESIAGRRWAAAYKRKIRASRIDLTRELADSLLANNHKPRHWINASAIGYYGDTGSTEVTEESCSGEGFSAELCRDWEMAAQQAAERLSCKLSIVRLGVVLDSKGGAFPQMYLPFRFGIGNWPGHGHQYLSWIHRSDVIRALITLINAGNSGIFNLTAPEPVTYRALASAINTFKPLIFSAGAPAFLMKCALGEMANELLLSGQRVRPTRLLDTGFTFDYPTIDRALANILKKD